MPNDDTHGHGPARADKLRGQCVLLVEDEAPIALLLEDMLDELGFDIGASASTLPKAIEALSRGTFAFAIVDVNLGGEWSFPLARILCDRSTPFIFSTGYGVQAIPPEFADVPLIAKPFTREQLADKIAGILKYGMAAPS
jgi:DNA-binding response OmpR family regulator